MLYYSVALLLGCLALCQSLMLQPYQPGVIPDLSKMVRNVPGGQTEIQIFHSPKQLNVIRNLVAVAIDQVQQKEKNHPGYTDHLLLRVLQANKQVANGVNIYVTFTVGREICPINLEKATPAHAGYEIPCVPSKQNSQGGTCYFKIYVQPSSSEYKVVDSVCIHHQQ